MALPFVWTLMFLSFLKERSNLFFLTMSILRQRKSLIKPPSPSLITVLDDTLPPCPSPSSGSSGYPNIALIVPASGRVTWLQISRQQYGRFTKGTKFYGNSNMETWVFWKLFSLLLPKNFEPSTGLPACRRLLFPLLHAALADHWCIYSL